MREGERERREEEREGEREERENIFHHSPGWAGSAVTATDPDLAATGVRE